MIATEPRHEIKCQIVLSLVESGATMTSIARRNNLSTTRIKQMKDRALRIRRAKQQIQNEMAATVDREIRSMTTDELQQFAIYVSGIEPL